MKNSIYSEKKSDNFNRYLFGAIISHILIIFTVFLIEWFLNLNFFPKDVIKTKVIQSAVRVDIVGMPKFTVQELKQMKVAPISETAKKVDSEISQAVEKSDLEFKKVSKKVDLSKLLKNISNKKEIAKKKNVKKDLRKMIAENKSLRSLVLEGNKVSKGANIVGDNINEEQSLFNDYITNLPNLVRPNWKLPSYLLNQELKCRIRLYIAANGKILRTQVYESSGVEEFDQKALKAVKASDPLPPPNKEILTKVASGEVILGFPL